MNVWQTVVVFAGIPLAGFVLLALLVFASSAGRAPRYRPGRPWEHDAVWYVAHPRVAAAAAARAEGHAAIGTAGERPALPGGGTPASVLDVPARSVKGGASGEW